MEDTTEGKVQELVRSSSTWSFAIMSPEIPADEERGLKAERTNDFIGSQSTISGDPGSLLSLNSLNQHRRSSFNKSCNTLVNRYTTCSFFFYLSRYGSIYEMEEKEEDKEEENEEEENKSPPSEFLLTCHIEDELTSAQSMCNLDMPPPGKLKRKVVYFRL